MIYALEGILTSSTPLTPWESAPAQKVAAWLSFKQRPCWRRTRNHFSSLSLATHSLRLLRHPAPQKVRAWGELFHRLQGQGGAQKTGGRLAEMHTLWQSVFPPFLWNALPMEVILTVEVSVLSVLLTANICPSLRLLGTINRQPANSMVKARFSPSGSCQNLFTSDRNYHDKEFTK